jgi:hypothetical protein
MKHSDRESRTRGLTFRQSYATLPAVGSTPPGSIIHRMGDSSKCFFMDSLRMEAAQMTSYSPYLEIAGTPDELDAVMLNVAVQTVILELADAADRLPAITAATELGHLDPDSPARARTAMAMLNRRRVAALGQYQAACRRIPGGHARVKSLLHSVADQVTPSTTPTTETIR